MTYPLIRWILVSLTQSRTTTLTTTGGMIRALPTLELPQIWSLSRLHEVATRQFLSILDGLVPGMSQRDVL
jgi:hypothetical protein